MYSASDSNDELLNGRSGLYESVVPVNWYSLCRTPSGALAPGPSGYGGILRQQSLMTSPVYPAKMIRMHNTCNFRQIQHEELMSLVELLLSYFVEEVPHHYASF